MQWIRQKTIKRVIYFIYNCRCWKCTYYCYFNIFFSFYYEGNHDIICLYIVFLPRCSNTLPSLIILLFLTPLGGSRTSIITPFYSWGNWLPNGHSLNVSRMISNNLSGTYSLDFHIVCPLGCFCRCWLPASLLLWWLPSLLWVEQSRKCSFLPKHKAESTLQIVISRRCM